MIYNALRGHFRLLHPIGFMPLMMVYMTVPPLIYNITGEPILHTSRVWSENSWFLAEPLLVLGLGGVFYHVGVRLSKTSLMLGPRDEVNFFLRMQSIRGIPGAILFFICCLVLALAILSRLVMPMENFAKGYYWMHLFFISFYILPIFVFHQNQKWGLLFLLLILPSPLLLRSKAAFLYIAIAFIVFYQGKLFKLSKVITLIILTLILLTPAAVELYSLNTAYTADYKNDVQNLLDYAQGSFQESWVNSILIISHREYAFESFSCVYQKRREGEPLYWGEKTFIAMALNIPSFIWPEKPFTFDAFPAEYLPLDYRGYTIHYAQHTLTPFFLDFDIPGVCLGMIFIGYLFGYSYRLALDQTIRRLEIWPLIIYSTLIINAKYIVESNIFNGLIHAMGMALGGLLVVWLSYYCVGRKFTLVRNSISARLPLNKSYF